MFILTKNRFKLKPIFNRIIINKLSMEKVVVTISETCVENNQNNDGETESKKQKLNEDKIENPVDLTVNDKSTLQKKRKYALLIGYQGSGYYGLQR